MNLGSPILVEKLKLDTNRYENAVDCATIGSLQSQSLL